MTNKGRIIAGENIFLEKKNNDIVIHCSPLPAPQSNQHGGFFKLEVMSENGAALACRISNCIFKLNGKYVQIDDYEIKSHYAEKELIYLRINKSSPERSNLSVELAFTDSEDFENPSQRHLDDSSCVLLYILTVRNSRLRVESFAAGGLIDTVLLPEGFVFALADGSLNSTFTRTSWGDENKFEFGDTMYIPCYNPQKKEGINISLPLNRGGALQIGKGDTYYSWRSTGLPGYWPSGDYITVKIDPEKIYF